MKKKDLKLPQPTQLEIIILLMKQQIILLKKKEGNK